MKKQILFFKVMIFSWLVTTVYAQENEVTGRWYAKEMDESIIEIQQNEKGMYEGIIKESSRDDFIGKKVMYDFKYNEENKRFEGRIYSVARKMELDGIFILNKPDELKVTGKKLFISKTFYWKRK